MLLNPYGPLPILQGTRILTETFGLVGFVIEDPHEYNRRWVITRLFAPVQERILGGIRAKLVDNKGFISFVNQRDLELLLDLAKPGDWCPWLEKEYPGLVEEEGWHGFCCDAADLLDDLHEHELLLRQELEGILPSNLEYQRRIHGRRGADYEELLIFLWDKDPETNYGPDGRLETLKKRWACVEKKPLNWERLH